MRRTPAAMLGVWTLRGEQVNKAGLKGPLTPRSFLAESEQGRPVICWDFGEAGMIVSS